MKILSANQIKEADRYTVQNEPISSVLLMERASVAMSEWIESNISQKSPLLFFIGKGNNGGDGLAVARILNGVGYSCSVFMLFDKEELSEDCKYNFQRLPESIKQYSISDIEIGNDTIIIDALLGTGVKGEIKPPLISVISFINQSPNKIISIDLPSGMRAEFGNGAQPIVEADTTLTLQFPKVAMLLPEAGGYCGKIVVLPIGLSEDYINDAKSPYYYITETSVSSLLMRRAKFAHKNTFGHTLLICGSEGMNGAAVLATGAALRSGCGLVTLHLPKSERFAVQSNYPSAMLSLDEGSCFSKLPNNLDQYTSIGIGCGLGQSKNTVDIFRQLLKMMTKPMVIDADAINILADNPDFQVHIPSGSILTPHLGELKRLLGEWQSEEEKLYLVRKFSSEKNVILVVKGAHTMICLSSGECYFNSTGNSGMAKGGSGDVLTGYITGLLARGYNSISAAIIGVYVHGMAGDIAADTYGEEAMNSADIIDCLALASIRI